MNRYGDGQRGWMRGRLGEGFMGSMVGGRGG
jgi:hypothetical protein